MIHFYATRKVLNANRIEPKLHIIATGSAQLMQKWYIDLIPTGFPGKSLLLFVHVESHLSILVRGKSLHKSWPEFQQRLITFLYRSGFPKEMVVLEEKNMESYTLSKTNSKSLLAHINQIKYSMEYWLAEFISADAIDLDQLENLLFGLLFLNSRTKEYISPKSYWEKTLGKIGEDF